MPYIYYDPNEPGGREKAYLQMLGGVLCLFGIIGSIWYYVYSVIELCDGYLTADILFSIGATTFVAFIVFLIFKSTVIDIREYAKLFFLFFFAGLVAVGGITAIGVAIRDLYNYGDGGFLLFIGIVILIIAVSVAIYFFRRIKGLGRIKWFTDKPSTITNVPTAPSHINKNDNNQKINDNEAFFCHKCGSKLRSDSDFCSFCGAKVK